jgi:competence protein ComEA
MSREQQGVVLFLSLSLALFFFLTSPSSAWKEFSGRPSEERTLPSPLAEGQILIEVDGSVNQRGMVQIEPGMTLLEALERAGGVKGKLSLSPEALSTKIDKSSRLQVIPDGEGKGKVSLEPLAPPKLKVLSIPIPINTASVEELDTLPGIGPKTAQAIFEYRGTHGKFTSAEDLLQVPGIGPKKLAALKPHITAP